MNWLRGRPLAILGIMVIALLALGVGLAVAANRAAPTRPLVVITGTFPEQAGISGQPVVVFLRAFDPDGIARVELWVNGQMVASQINPDEESLGEFATNQAWIPTGEGNFLIIVRAEDGEGFTGDSDPFLLQVFERAYGGDGEESVEYIAQEDDTLEDVAVRFGLSPEELVEHNPRLGDLAPGTRLEVPHIPEEDGAEVGAPSGVGEEIPHVDPPAPPEPGGEAEEAEPLDAPWWSRLPLPLNFGCLFAPETCRRAIDMEPPPFPPPGGVLAEHFGGCTVELSWIDNSENEVGFRVYRFVMRPRFRFELLDLRAPNPGSGTRLIYNDDFPPIGSFFYSVVAFNAGGQTWSVVSEEVTIAMEAGCGGDPGAARALAVEGLDMEVAGDFERLYCYASLNGSPYERIPHGASNFIELDGAGSWDIAEHFSGRNKRTVMAEIAVPLPLTVECLGWQGEELTNLGRFEQAHPSEEWDGRELVGSPAGGGFRLTYRILPSFAAVDDGGRADWPLIDPGLEPPFNLRDTLQETCTPYPENPELCYESHQVALTWDFDHPEMGFRVYQRFESGAIPRLYYTVPASEPPIAPLFEAYCGSSIFYSVSAIVGTDPLTGEDIQTPLSAELEVPPCATLEITLNGLWVPEGSVRDGDAECGVRKRCQTYEAYGWLSFNGHRVVWNNHCDPGAFGTCLGPGPRTTSVRAYGSYLWELMTLNTGGSWRAENNVIRIPIQEGEKLNWSFQLWDHDSTSGDDIWCDGEGAWAPNFEYEAESGRWEGYEKSLSDGDYRCTIFFRVRGLPAE